MEDHIPIRPDRSLLIDRNTSEWSFWDVVIHENYSKFFLELCILGVTNYIVFHFIGLVHVIATCNQCLMFHI